MRYLLFEAVLNPEQDGLRCRHLAVGKEIPEELHASLQLFTDGIFLRYAYQSAPLPGGIIFQLVDGFKGGAVVHFIPAREVEGAFDLIVHIASQPDALVRDIDIAPVAPPPYLVGKTDAGRESVVDLITQRKADVGGDGKIVAGLLRLHIGAPFQALEEGLGLLAVGLERRNIAARGIAIAPLRERRHLCLERGELALGGLQVAPQLFGHLAGRAVAIDEGLADHGAGLQTGQRGGGHAGIAAAGDGKEAAEQGIIPEKAFELGKLREDFQQLGLELGGIFESLLVGLHLGAVIVKVFLVTLEVFYHSQTIELFLQHLLALGQLLFYLLGSVELFLQGGVLVQRFFELGVGGEVSFLQELQRGGERIEVARIVGRIFIEGGGGGLQFAVGAGHVGEEGLGGYRIFFPELALKLFFAALQLG